MLSNKKPLDPSIILLSGIKFNSEIEYVEGDDIWNFDDTEVNNENYLENENYYQKEKLQYLAYTNHPKITYKPFHFQFQNLRHLYSNTQTINLELNKDSLKEFNNVLFSNNVDSDGIHYIANTDWFVIDKETANNLTSKNKEFSVTLYNMNLYNKDYSLFKNKFDIISVPDFELKYIPENGVISIMEEKYNPKINAVYLNFPKSLYKSLIILTTGVVFDYTNNRWLFDFKNSTAFNFYTYDVAKNGFKKPVPLVLNKDWTFSSLASQNKVFLAQYLNLESFPVCIYLDKQNLIWKGEDLPVTGDEKGIKDFLYPYIIF